MPGNSGHNWKKHTIKPTGASNMNLHKEINDLVQGTLEITGKSGHTKDRCYKLHGYPSNPRLQKGKGTVFAANVCASDVNRHQTEEEPKLRRQMPLNLSKDQYEQLLISRELYKLEMGLQIQTTKTAC
ncbi:hypothetical protein KY285_023797 [Solanum tuberosum]|nr:hypothetical protein KY289_024129 [Solanum tuberosum]KAH0675996.1 hypothetical protein KY285_023797 [Solanum tuberosum]